MRNWRVLTAVIAVVFGIAAAAGSYYYLNKADERAQSKQKLVSVLVAKKSIPQATPGAVAIDGDFVAIELRTKADVPDAAVYSKEQIRTFVAAATIDAGSIITVSSFVSASLLKTGLPNQLEKNKGLQAMSISVDLQHGVAGLISPGDRINIIVSSKASDPNNKNDKTSTLDFTAFLLPGIKVLAVDKTTAAPAATQTAATGSDTKGGVTTPTTAAPQQQNLGLLTLEVTNRQAEQLAHAYSQAWPLYLTLNPAGFDPKDFKPTNEIVALFNEFDQDLKTLKQYEASVPH